MVLFSTINSLGQKVESARNKDVDRQSFLKVVKARVGCSASSNSEADVVAALAERPDIVFVGETATDVALKKAGDEVVSGRRYVAVRRVADAAGTVVRWTIFVAEQCSPAVAIAVALEGEDTSFQGPHVQQYGNVSYIPNVHRQTGDIALQTGEGAPMASIGGVALAPFANELIAA